LRIIIIILFIIIIIIIHFIYILLWLWLCSFWSFRWCIGSSKRSSLWVFAFFQLQET